MITPDSPTPAEKDSPIRCHNLDNFSLNSLLAEIKDTSIDFDMQWHKFDMDNNGYLDIKESVYFLDEIKRLIQKEQTYYFSADRNYQLLLKEFDIDTNGFLDKPEMAQLIAKCLGIQIQVPSTKIDSKNTTKKWQDLQVDPIIEEKFKKLKDSKRSLNK